MADARAAEPPAPPRRFAFLLVDGFSLLSLAAAVDPLRMANRLSGRDIYAWTATTANGAPARASSGLEIAAAGPFRDAPPAALTLVVAGLLEDPPEAPALIAELRRRARRGEALGGVSTGQVLLGRAGLLDGRRCTVHWERRAAFVAAAPRARVTEAPYEIDGDRLTSAGGTASIDMMLRLIEQDGGAALARAVANQFQHERIRSSADRQRPAAEPDLAGRPEPLRRVVRLMADNLEAPLPAQALARAAHLSLRQVERLFLRHVGLSPSAYYIRLRLDRARELLRQTDAPVLDVALSVGFASQSHFAQSYRAAFGVSPSEERRAR
jgi:transcriptional regulator GlxA family with amidase domain